MSKYCKNCGNQISLEEKFCKICGNKVCEETEIAKNTEFDGQSNSSEMENTYEFIVDKATFRFMSTKIMTIATIKNNILSTSMKCKSKILNKKNFNGQINISDISSVKYNKYATIALYDIFLFVLIVLVAAFSDDSPYSIIAYSALSGVVLWRTLTPSLQIRTKDNRCFNILFSPQDNGKIMLKLISQITGKEIDENSEIKIPFSKKPFVAVFISAIVAFILFILI